MPQISLCRMYVSVAMLAIIAPAMADPTMECSAGSQVETGNCLNDMAGKADTAMKTALGFAMNAAVDIDSATGRKIAAPALRAAQEAWLAYRDTHCEFVGTTFGGGSGTGIAIQDCRIVLTRDRTDQLMQFAR